MSLLGGDPIAEAVIKISEGETDRLTVLYDRLGRMIFALAMSILNNYADAEDAMQDTFVKVASSAGEFRPDGNAKAWIMAIARNCAVDRLRERAKSPVAEPDGEIASDSPDVAEVCALNDLMSRLDETDRQIVVLRAVDRMRYGEIADVFGLTAEGVRKRYQRAIQKMRSL